MNKCIVALFICSPFLLSQNYSKAIEDNSYFIEEAYNQEEQVVQHIFTGLFPSTGGSTDFNVTQEWPLFGQMHQLSVTVPYSIFSTPALSGYGDILVNYRYQLIRNRGLAVSPRVSVILPTGGKNKGIGKGKTGVQFNLPVSQRWSNEVVTHGNAGFGITPDVGIKQSTATVTDFFAGVSGIFLASEHFNVITEVLYTSTGSTFGRSDKLIVSPGVRWAHDIGELQIVPGIAYPFMFTSAGQSNAIFLYVSFEHPY